MHTRNHIGSLASGNALRPVPEPDNPVDEEALLVCDHGHRLGYTPRPLLPYVHQIIRDNYRLTVDRVNPESAGFHVRLLVRLEGTLPTSDDWLSSVPSEHHPHVRRAGFLDAHPATIDQ